MYWVGVDRDDSRLEQLELLSPRIMSVQYTGGVQYNRGCSAHRGIPWVHWGVQYTGGYHEYTGRYHDKCGGKSLGKQLNLYGNPSVLKKPQCTEHLPVYSWYPPHSSWYPQCTEHPPLYSMIYFAKECFLVWPHDCLCKVSKILAEFNEARFYEFSEEFNNEFLV